MNALIKETIKKHRRIIFNGNNYSEEWVKESEKRGLLNLKSVVEAAPYLISEKNINCLQNTTSFQSLRFIQDII